MKVIAITGTTNGLGFELAKRCAAHGCELILLNRPSERSMNALDALKAMFPTIRITSVSCDLTSFQSVRSAASNIRTNWTRLDVLCNNAGIMAVPYELTDDGHEIQMQTNHLSHVLLVEELMPLLIQTGNEYGNARIVTHTSVARWIPPISVDWYDAIPTADYFIFAWLRYQQTKRANMVTSARWVNEFDKTNVMSVAAHPGISQTHLAQNTAGIMRVVLRAIGTRVEEGVMPVTNACLDRTARSGDFYTPSGKKRMDALNEA